MKLWCLLFGYLWEHYTYDAPYEIFNCAVCGARKRQREVSDE